jgi:hypothetical protein
LLLDAKYLFVGAAALVSLPSGARDITPIPKGAEGKRCATAWRAIKLTAWSDHAVTLARAPSTARCTKSLIGRTRIDPNQALSSSRVDRARKVGGARHQLD